MNFKIFEFFKFFGSKEFNFQRIFRFEVREFRVLRFGILEFVNFDKFPDFEQFEGVRGSSS